MYRKNFKEYLPIVADENEYQYQKALVLKHFIESSNFNESDNNLIVLYGEWGSGKSTVFKTLESILDKSKYSPLIFEAWKYEKDKNLPLSLYEFILDKIINNKDAFFEVLKEGIGDGLLSFSKGFTFNFGIASADISKVSPSKEESSLYTLTENFIEKFQEKIDKYRNGKQLVIFIDDLDRCEDENIVSLLSALKLMFSLSNIIFICGVDKSAVINSLKVKYSDNNEEKAEIFLDKIFPVEYNLGQSIFSLKKYDNDFPTLKEELLLQQRIVNPRKISRIFNKYLSLIEFTVDPNPIAQRVKRFILFLYIINLKKEINWDYEDFVDTTSNNIVSSVPKPKKGEKRIRIGSFYFLFREVLFFENLEIVEDFNYAFNFNNHASELLKKVRIYY